MKFAAKTSVNPQKTRQEIETVLARYGASAFMYATEGENALIQFKLNNWLIRYQFTIPSQEKFRSQAQYEQAVRQKWRALLLIVKAKLEWTSSGITTIEREFLDNIVCEDGQTIGNKLIPDLKRIVATSKPLLMLPPAN